MKKQAPHIAFAGSIAVGCISAGLAFSLPAYATEIETEAAPAVEPQAEVISSSLQTTDETSVSSVDETPAPESLPPAEEAAAGTHIETPAAEETPQLITEQVFQTGTVVQIYTDDLSSALDVAGASTANGASIISYTQHGGQNQLFSLKWTGEGYYQIISRASGKALDVAAGQLDDARILQWQAHSGQNQRFGLITAAQGRYRIVSALDPSYYLSRRLNAKTGLSELTLSQSLDDATQLFVFSRQAGVSPSVSAGYTDAFSNQVNADGIIVSPLFDSGTTISISSALNRNKSLDIAGASSANGASTLLWAKHGGTNQSFILEAKEPGYYLIRSLNSGKVLDVAGGSTAAGAAVLQYQEHGGANQLWGFIQVGPQTFELAPKINPKLRLDLFGGSAANGTKAIVWSSHTGQNQRFYIEKNQALSSAIQALDQYESYKPIRLAKLNFELQGKDLNLDIFGGSTRPGTKIALWDRHGGPSQQFSLIAHAKGLYQIALTADSSKVVVANARGGYEVAAASASPAQYFYLAKSGEGFKLVSLLGLKAAKTLPTDELALTQTQATDSSAATFTLSAVQPIANGSYRIQLAQVLPLVLDVQGGTAREGAALGSWNTNGQANQLFTFAYDATADAYTIQTIGNMYVRQDSWGNVVLSATKDSRALWQLKARGAGWTFVNLLTTKAMELANTTMLPGVRVRGANYSGRGQQTFYLHEANWDYYDGVDPKIRAFIKEAEQYAGRTFVMGGRNPQEGFDCAGLIEWAANKVLGANIDTEYTNVERLYHNHCVPISREELKPGDLIIYQGTYQRLDMLGHSMIYVGNGLVFGATNPVRYCTIDTIKNMYGGVAIKYYARLKAALPYQ